MKKLIVNNKQELERLIKKEIQLNGVNCDLNHIDVSNITNMQELFYKSEFTGNISTWDVSKVKDMSKMFTNSLFDGDISMWNVTKVETMNEMFSSSQFNGDISKWDVTNVTDMYSMFYNSKFNGDISQWNVKFVERMSYMFCGSEFKGDLTMWRPINLLNGENTFHGCAAPSPYWAKYNNIDDRNEAIYAYDLYTKMKSNLPSKNNGHKKMKV